jgi:threonine dehydratase
MLPSFATVREAQEVLKPYLPVTRLVAATSLSQQCNVYLKLESELPTGSFKPRGAIFGLSREMSRRQVREVVASSTGNHGAAVAYAARLLGVAATIFLPENPNPVKRARIAALGANIIERGRDLSHAGEEVVAYAQARGAYFLNDAGDSDLPAGPATIALEILDQLPKADVLFVPMGDTALIRGVAAAAKQLRPRIKVIGIQAERAPSYFLSWKQGTPVSTETCETIADGLATRTPDAGNVQAIREVVDEVRLVSDAQMLSAIRHLLLEEHLVAEPAGAATTAALLAGNHPAGQNIVLLVSGCNIAPHVLRQALCG